MKVNVSITGDSHTEEALCSWVCKMEQQRRTKQNQKKAALLLILFSFEMSPLPLQVNSSLPDDVMILLDLHLLPKPLRWGHLT